MTTGELEQIARCARKLVNRLSVIHRNAQYKAVWFTAQNHGIPYTGPKYDVELHALRKALRPAKSK